MHLQSISVEKMYTKTRTAYIISIYKKDNKLKSNKYRGISITNRICTVYRVIIRDMIEQEYTNCEEVENCGFRAGRSCIDKVFSLK